MKTQIKDITDEEIINAVNDFQNNNKETPDIALANKYPPKVILKKMQKMEEKGILNYGVSLRTAWVEK